MLINKRTKIVLGIIAVTWSAFQLYTGIFGLLAPLQQRGIHLTFALVVAFMLYPYKKVKKAELVNEGNSVNKEYVYWDQILLAILSAVVGMYVIVNHMAIFSNIGNFTIIDIMVAVLGVLLLLEATRRVTGWGLPIIAGIFIIYQLAGAYMPQIIRHPGVSLTKTFTYQFLGLEGVFGISLGVSAAFIFLFILYARFLQATGGGQIFIDLATSLVGHVRGGPAKIAVVASSFFGSISGSAVANVVGTGSFTIPLMKKYGYEPHFAGAVEAVSSSGGQFMPPIMGSAAFLIAEILGMPYWKVALYAAVPAVLYYLAVFFMVDFEAARTNLGGLKRNELPSARKIFKEGWSALLSPVVLVLLLTFLQWSPGKAVVYAIAITIVTSFATPKYRLNKEKFYAAMRDGAYAAIDTVLACATVGIVIGSIMQTGLGFKFSSILISLAGGNLVLLLFLTMIASIVLGMGLPTVACYLVLAIMVAPVLIKIGVIPIAAHLFIFYFGIISAITPPVALAAYVGAGIAGASFVKTGFTATKLGLSAFILPFMFVYNPALILQGNITEILQCLVTGTIGIFSLSVALEGYFLKITPLWERVVFGSTALLLIVPEFNTDVCGLIIFTVIAVRHIITTRKNRLETA